MNMKKYILFFTVLALGLMISCDNEKIVSYYSTATISSFKFASNDSFPGLAEATFVVDNLPDTGRIYLKDSIRYGTPLDSVVPVITFTNTVSGAVYYFPDTTIHYTGEDTLNFNKKPVYLRVYSQDLTVEKVYSIEAYAHQVNPDLFVWKLLNPAITKANPFEQHMVYLASQFHFYTNDGFVTKHFSSPNAKEWNTASLSGLPNDCAVKQIIVDSAQARLCYATKDALYTSQDASTWTSTPFPKQNHSMVRLLACLSDASIALVKDENQDYYLATMSKDLQLTPITGVLADDFAVQGFTVLNYTGMSHREYVMLYGGYDKMGTMVNGRWVLECKSNGQQVEYRLVNLSSERPHAKAIVGAGLVQYGDYLYSFGGLYSDLQVCHQVYVSKDEGMNWQPVDTTHFAYPQEAVGRYNQTIMVHEDNIYLVGGQNQNSHFTDVYVGRLNSITW